MNGNIGLDIELHGQGVAGGGQRTFDALAQCLSERFGGIAESERDMQFAACFLQGFHGFFAA